MRRGRPLYRALGSLESVRGHVWGRDYVRDVPRDDVLDCKTERAGERMAEAPRRSIRKLDFYCADPLHRCNSLICPAALTGHFFVEMRRASGPYLLLSRSPVHDLARASIVGQRSLKQLPERPRARDNLWLGAPPVLKLRE
jgi:hypothetical protein